MELMAGFLVGIVGSLHCVGMCGPIAMAIPHRKPDKFSIMRDNLTYNFGRVITYVLLGVALGLIGTALSFSGLQEKISIAIGVLLLLFVLIPKLSKISNKSNRFLHKFIASLKSKFSYYLKKKGSLALLTLGLLNGLLPCGLVYAALAASLAISNPLNSALFMLGFGFGTVPVMAAINFASGIVTPKLRMKFSKLIPYSIALIAIIMILRGMSLGIPYISPQLPDKVTQETEACCH